ncbi:MAG: histidine kinase [Flavobacterium sp.]
MEQVQPIQTESDSKKNVRYFFLSLAAAIPIFITAHAFAHVVNQHDDEMVAGFITFYSIVGVFAGRSLSQIWHIRYRKIPDSVFRLLGIVIAISLILIFFVAQYSMSINNSFLSLLLLGFPLLLFSVSLGMIIKLIRTTIKTQLGEAKANAAQSQGELKFLQTQLSPHFLFNTLNNIYGISLTQHEKIPGLLLKLSSLLRYSVYDVKELFVPLKNEIAYINDYIDFEKIRIGDKLVLNTSFDGPIDPEIKIAPLLLIVFIENAFKHSKNTVEQKIYIDISLKTWGNSILFSVKNSSSGVREEKNMLNASSGFGLENVMKRLELLYNKEYILETQNKDGYYTVLLQLKAK